MTGVDINAYLRATRQKLTRDPFNAALRLAEKGRYVGLQVAANAGIIIDQILEESRDKPAQPGV